MIKPYRRLTLRAMNEAGMPCVYCKKVKKRPPASDLLLFSFDPMDPTPCEHCRDPKPVEAEDTDLVQCEYCDAEPMRSRELGGHQGRKHGLLSTNPASVRRRISRDNVRGITREKTVRPPPPTVPDVPTHRALRQKHILNPGEMEQLRKWVLYAVHNTYAPLLDAPPSVIVEAIRLHCVRNFEPPRFKRRQVSLIDIP